MQIFGLEGIGKRHGVVIEIVDKLGKGRYAEYEGGNRYKVALDTPGHAYLQAFAQAELRAMQETDSEYFSGYVSVVFDALRNSGVDIDSIVKEQVNELEAQGIEADEENVAAEYAADAILATLWTKRAVNDFFEWLRTSMEPDDYKAFLKNRSQIARQTIDYATATGNKLLPVMPIKMSDSDMQDVTIAYYGVGAMIGSWHSRSHIEENAAIAEALWESESKKTGSKKTALSKLRDGLKGRRSAKEAKSEEQRARTEGRGGYSVEPAKGYAGTE